MSGSIEGDFWGFVRLNRRSLGIHRYLRAEELVLHASKSCKGHASGRAAFVSEVTRDRLAYGTNTTLIGSPSRSLATRNPSWIWSSGKRWVTSSPQRILPCAANDSARRTAAAPSPRVV